jgi:hypothetical protein
MTNIDMRKGFQSPKFKRIPEFQSKATIRLPSPTAAVGSKDRLKRSIFKVKDPERFDKLLKTLETDLVEAIDFSGLELGNELVKDLCFALKDCRRIRSVRLTRNSLNDDCLSYLIDCLSSIEVLNLAQNAFSSKIFTELL